MINNLFSIEEIGKNHIKELYELSIEYKIEILWKQIEQFIQHSIKKLIHCKTNDELAEDDVIDLLEICDHIGFNQGLEYLSNLLSSYIERCQLKVKYHHVSSCTDQGVLNDKGVENQQSIKLFGKLRATTAVRLQTKLFVLAPFITTEWNRNVGNEDENQMKWNLKKIDKAFGKPTTNWILDISRKIHVFRKKEPFM